MSIPKRLSLANEEAPVVITCAFDIHFGSIVGVSIPGFYYNKGQLHTPSELQEQINQHWHDSWAKTLTLVNDYKAKHAFFVSELVEGDHHGSKETWAPLVSDQLRGVVELLKPIKEKVDLFGVINGTAAHSGQMAEWDNLAAGSLKAAKLTTRRGDALSAYRVRLPISKFITDLAHHGSSPGGRAWLKGNAFRSRMISQF